MYAMCMVLGGRVLCYVAVMLERKVFFFFFSNLFFRVQEPILAPRECTCVHFQLRRVK
jgi:hypothetical protein